MAMSSIQHIEIHTYTNMLSYRKTDKQHTYKYSCMYCIKTHWHTYIHTHIQTNNIYIYIYIKIEKKTDIYTGTHIQRCMYLQLCVFVCIYAYIIIIIIIIIKYILDIYISNSWNLDCNPLVSWSFFKTTIIRQLRKWNESKIEKIQSKTVVVLYDFLRVVVSVCVCVCVCVRVCVYRL